MKVVMITGASRGLGEALAKHLMESEDQCHLICIARNVNRDLQTLAAKKRIKLDFLQADLARVENLEDLMVKAFYLIDKEKVTGLYLVNNAGTVEPIAPLAKVAALDLQHSVMINLAAPLALSAAFIRQSQSFRVEKRVVTITSGASKRAVEGWSVYCSTKAGVNLFTACAAAEESDQPYGVQLAAFSPGVMDTDMQRIIRSSRKEDFRQLDDFIRFKKEGVLRSPALVAEKLSEVMFAPDFPNGAFVDLKDLLSPDLTETPER